MFSKSLFARTVSLVISWLFVIFCVTVIVFVERVPSFVRFVPTVILPFVAVIVAFSAFDNYAFAFTVGVVISPEFVIFVASTDVVALSVPLFVIFSVTVIVFVERVPSFVRFAACKVSIVKFPLPINKLPISFVVDSVLGSLIVPFV